MPEATLSVLLRFGKKLAAIDDQVAFINNICSDDAWPIVGEIGEGKIEGWEAQQLLKEIRSRIKRFEQPEEILAKVLSFGDQFETARLTVIPGGETLESQRDNGVIGFRSNWHFNPEEIARLSVSPSIGSEVIYLADLIEGSLDCTYDKVDERDHVEAILDRLPKVEGLQWIVGNTTSINRVLANHLEETGVELLPTVYTRASDTYNHPTYGLRRLFVGRLCSRRVRVDYLPPSRSDGSVGLFVLGVPA
ncbi:MAG TPA: hypothetical protein VF303_02925 [Candidatus Nanoarchaeia archaeon]